MKAFVGLLTEWNVRHNLVSRASLDDVWRRHVWDSAQLAAFTPSNARSLVDLGSGAGFPGLILAILHGDKPGFRTVLYEATQKKCDFLRAAGERVGVPAEVRAMRIEGASPEIFDVVTSRACAPLPKLLGYASRFQGPDTVNLFLKGQNVEAEIGQAAKYWNTRLARHPSQSDPSGMILEIRELARVR